MRVSCKNRRVGEATIVNERRQTLSEEIANSISHGVALALAIMATPILIVSAMRAGTTRNIVGVSVFAASMILLYLASTLYHAIPHERAKQIFRVIDHSAIFLLIAGTYTPFTLGVLRGPWGWTIFGIVWGLAIAGLIKKAILGARYTWLSMILYLVMGWLALIAIPQLLERVPLSGLALILAGGIAYTGGITLFAVHRLRYAHFAWHLFVIAGTTCHFFAVLWYSA